tara:strand:+ start:8948 stop:11302 length:2355 start_codon:yes stop_codon:yes gene_type:complete
MPDLKITVGSDVSQAISGLSQVREKIAQVVASGEGLRGLVAKIEGVENIARGWKMPLPGGQQSNAILELKEATEAFQKFQVSSTPEIQKRLKPLLAKMKGVGDPSQASMKGLEEINKHFAETILKIGEGSIGGKETSEETEIKRLMSSVLLAGEGVVRLGEEQGAVSPQLQQMIQGLIAKEVKRLTNLQKAGKAYLDPKQVAFEEFEYEKKWDKRGAIGEEVLKEKKRVEALTAAWKKYAVARGLVSAVEIGSGVEIGIGGERGRGDLTKEAFFEKYTPTDVKAYTEEDEYKDFRKSKTRQKRRLEMMESKIIKKPPIQPNLETFPPMYELEQWYKTKILPGTDPASSLVAETPVYSEVKPRWVPTEEEARQKRPGEYGIRETHQRLPREKEPKGIQKVGKIIDDFSTKMLQKANPLHKTNAQISDSAQLFLALGGILSPISPTLGRIAMQAGFSAFALGGVGIALTGVTLMAGASLQAVKLWTSSTLTWIKAAHKAGAITGNTAKIFKSLDNSMDNVKINLGVTSAEAFSGSAASINRLTSSLTEMDSGLMKAQEKIASLADGLLLAVTLPLEALTSVDQLVKRMAGDYSLMGGMAEITANIGLGNRTNELLMFISDMGSIMDQMPTDEFIDGLTKFEQTLQLSGANLRKWGSGQAMRGVTKENRFDMHQRNLVGAVMKGVMNIDEAAKVSAIENNKLFKNDFTPTLTSLMNASSGVVKEVLDPNEPGNRAIEKQLTALEAIKAELEKQTDHYLGVDDDAQRSEMMWSAGKTGINLLVGQKVL